MTDQTPPPARPERRVWNYTPDLPIKLAPYWDWPMRPLAAAAYLLRSWNPVGLRFLFLVAAFVVWTWFTPDLSRAETIRFDWIAEVWLRNFILLTGIAGGLHLLLWRFAVQKDDYRYDMRPMMKGARAFWFRNQVWDNMFWSFVALQFWTFFECLIWYAYANGWATMITFETNPVWFVTLIVLIPIWAGFYFYTHHRLLHVGPFYRHVHSWHHKNVNTGPWSGLAMHPVESFVLMTDTLLFLLIPAHPVHVLFLLFHHGIGAPTSHAGFEKLKIGKGGIEVGDFFHQLHHRFFDCNYGTWETPWDKWFNTFHDGTSDGDTAVRERRRRIWNSAD
ncbi:sterol desaturase family protein [Loktanella sp. IMCC34160]|uniref:sterol desaturase family protein n=1 Tax=Loktanella sp. IMCC34160 TaxID=2510646 RepID=UPI00101DF8A8|nr:sterol desaturase family protein [Loktanella sp. IMCC34160]RYG90341.1 sterol desaturase family protein [Loktanella sp. IMCC34160]